MGLKGRSLTMMNKLKHFLILLLLCFVLISCQSNDHVIETIYDHLTATVLIEENFEKYQEQINELESEEHEIYNELIGLGDDDKEEIKELTKEAIYILDEKMEYIQLIKETLAESRKEFIKIEPFIDQVKDEVQLEYVNKMYDTMIKRYESYDKVYDSNVDSVQLTNELYEGFSSDDISAADIYSLIGDINDSYEAIIEANEQFNKETILYNGLKADFYELLDQNE